MNNIYRICVTAILISMASLGAFSQKAFYFGPDATVNVNDSIVIRLNDYEGSIQWQKSLDLDVWQNIPGATLDTLLFVADTTSYFRAEVIAGDCDPFYSDTTMVGVYKLNAATVIIDDYDVELLSDSTQIANGIFIYSGDLLGIIDIGSVLVSSVGEGYIRVVIEINPQKDVTEILTEGGDLTDVFDEIELEDFVQITMSDSEKSFSNGREIPMEVTYLLPGAKIDMNKSRFSFTGTNFTIEIPDPDDEDITHSITATVNHGSINFEPVFDRILDIGYLPVRVNRFGLIAGGDLDFELDVTLEAEIDITAYEAKKEFITFNIGPIFIGPVPMIISYTLEGVFKTGIQASGEISFGFKSGYEAQFGAIYDRNANPQWSGIWEAGNKPFTDEYLHSNVYSNIYASVGVENKLAARIAGVVGPYLSVEPYLRSDLGVSTSPPEWSFLLSVGIENKLGFDVRVIGKTLADFHTSLPGYSWDIYETGGVFEGNPPIVTTHPVTNITANSAQSGGNVTDDGDAPVTTRGVVWSTSQNPTIDNNEGYTTDGTGLGVFTSSITGLTPETQYYVRAYATNSAGTGYGQQEEFTTEDDGGGNGDDTQVVEVLNPATGKTWMDRNLGASRTATSSTDAEAYGHLYQWGRAADGHQIRTSGTTSTLSNSNTPGHGQFITTSSSPYDWRSPQNNDLWQGVNGINNPCPAGYRLPTEAELNAERLSWSSNNSAGAYASPLKLPVAGYRYYSDGSLYNVGLRGYYWSSAVSSTFSRSLSFNSSNALMSSFYRAYGLSVRCLKD